MTCNFRPLFSLDSGHGQTSANGTEVSSFNVASRVLPSGEI